MCSRARLSSDVSEIKLVFGIPPERAAPNITPSWNVAPTDPLPIVHYDSKGRCARPRRQGIQPDSREVELGSDYPSCPPREPNLPAKSPTAIDGFVPENRFA